MYNVIQIYSNGQQLAMIYTELIWPWTGSSQFETLVTDLTNA